MRDWSAWIGRSATQSDVLTPALVRRHRATLDAPAEDSTPLPGIHWCLCLPEATTAELGEDGHPRRDLASSFLPPIDLPRRMWASSAVEFMAPIAVGATVQRISRITDIVEKVGGSGRLAFVTVDHETQADAVVAVRETQTLVYREAVDPAGSGPRPARESRTPPPALPIAADSQWSHRHDLTPGEAMLFRFSALTFNSHRIHYDRPYARDVEGYPGLVVHGPLTATLLLGWASEQFGPIVRFAFRGVAPAFAGEPLSLAAQREGNTIELIAAGPSGSCMTATAQL